MRCSIDTWRSVYPCHTRSHVSRMSPSSTTLQASRVASGGTSTVTTSELIAELERAPTAPRTEATYSFGATPPSASSPEKVYSVAVPLISISVSGAGSEASRSETKRLV